MSNPTQSTPQPGIGSTQSTPQPDSTPQNERQPTTDSDSTVQEAVDQPKLNSRATSKVWNHFVRISSTSAECKHCGKKFAAHSKLNGTTTLNNHLSRCPKNENKAEKGQLNLIFPPPRPDQNVTLISGGFSKDMCRRMLVEFVIKDEMPFRMVEGEGFRAFCQAMEPRFKVPSRMTIYRDLLEMYKEEKDKLKAYFKAHKQRVSLTTDTWTSPNNLNYMCVTVHFINHDWKLQKRILMFCQVKGHSGSAIGKMLEKCLLQWGLEDVFTVTLDNVFANNVAMNYLKARVVSWTKAKVRAEFLQVRCSAHVLALVVKDAIYMYNKSIASIRSVVKYVTTSPARLAKFRHCVPAEKIECKRGLVLDVRTRWNSTYVMLDAAEKYQAAFERLEWDDTAYGKRFIFQEKSPCASPITTVSSTSGSFHLVNDIEDDSYSSSYSSCESDDEVVETSRGRKKKDAKKKKAVVYAPTKADWEYARSLVKCLKVFFDATVKFSASTQVTSHNFLWQLTLIHQQLVIWRDNVGDIFASRMADIMFRKYNQYWGDYDKMNSTLFIALLFDPREKEAGLKFILESLYEEDELVSSVCKKVREDLVRLYEEYRSIYSTAENVSNVVHVDVTPTVVQEVSIEAIMNSRKKRHRKTSDCVDGKSEVDRYLLDECEPADEKFDILAWWQVNSPKYKILSYMARDILAIPVSSVASESAFSTGKRILGPWRSSLSARTVEALLCTQSWLKNPSVLIFYQNIYQMSLHPLRKKSWVLFQVRQTLKKTSLKDKKMTRL